MKKLSIKEYKKIYSKVPRLCVEILIKYKKGMILTKRSIPPCKGMWHIPGGTVLFGETLQNAVKRVAKEETGLNIKIEKQIGIKEYSGKEGFGHPISIIYTCKAFRGELKKDKYASDIKTFKKAPKNIIKSHKIILNGL